MSLLAILWLATTQVHTQVHLLDCIQITESQPCTVRTSFSSVDLGCAESTRVTVRMCPKCVDRLGRWDDPNALNAEPEKHHRLEFRICLRMMDKYGYLVSVLYWQFHTNHIVLDSTRMTQFVDRLPVLIIRCRLIVWRLLAVATKFRRQQVLDKFTECHVMTASQRFGGSIRSKWSNNLFANSRLKVLGTW